jgi:hypothetical protein
MTLCEYTDFMEVQSAPESRFLIESTLVNCISHILAREALV